jgi:cystathionine gamma-synthase
MNQHIETLAVHTGAAVDPATGAVTPPIHLSTTFERQPDGGYTDGFVYSRTDNPSRRSLEACLTTLESGAGAAAFASGLAASSAVLSALRPGDHLLLAEDIYYGIRAIAHQLLEPWGLRSTSVNMTDLDAVRSAITPETRMIWVETPSNPQLLITDIAALAGIAHDSGALLACDNTWSSPVITRPLKLGADVVVHATTKYLGGHSDLTGGIVIVRERGPFFDRVRLNQNIGGAVPSPFDCWLLLRSIRTLPWRVRAHSANAAAVAGALDGHPAIERVNYPGLASHPGHAIAARQMDSFGGMLSIHVRGGQESALELTRRVRLWTRATSLGGVESLIEHRFSVEGPTSPTPPDLLRLSAGLEHPDDLVADLLQALSGL